MPRAPIRNTIRDIATNRREVVARLRTQGLTIYQIVDALPKQDPPILNHQGKPFGYMAVYNDLQALRIEWRQKASEEIDEHIAAQLATLNEVEKEGWARGNMDIVLRAVQMKMKLLGTDAPFKVQDWTMKDWKSYAAENGLKEEDVIAEAQRIIATRGGGGPVAETDSDSGEAE